MAANLNFLKNISHKLLKQNGIKRRMESLREIGAWVTYLIEDILSKLYKSHGRDNGKECEKSNAYISQPSFNKKNKLQTSAASSSSVTKFMIWAANYNM